VVLRKNISKRRKSCICTNRNGDHRFERRDTLVAAQSNHRSLRSERPMWSRSSDHAGSISRARHWPKADRTLTSFVLRARLRAGGTRHRVSIGSPHRSPLAAHLFRVMSAAESVHERWTLDPPPLVIVGDGVPESSQVFLPDGEGALELANLGLQVAVPLRELRYLHQ